MTEITSMIPDDVILNKIYIIRGMKVMLDRYLAELYNVETKRLKEAVRRNIKRFPEDFMFEMSKTEFEIWRTQFATSNSDKIGLRYSPFCFTEQGVTMLACTLNSDRAIEINIQIVRIFSRMRESLSNHRNLQLEIEEIKKKLTKHDKSIELVFKLFGRINRKTRKPDTSKKNWIYYRYRLKTFESFV